MLKKLNNLLSSQQMIFSYRQLSYKITICTCSEVSVVEILRAAHTQDFIHILKEYILGLHIALKNFNHCCFKVCNRLCVCPLKHKLSDILTRTKWQFLIYTGSSRIPHKTRNKKQQASFFFLLFRKKKKKVLKRGKITSGFSQIEQSEKDVVNCRKT